MASTLLWTRTSSSVGVKIGKVAHLTMIDISCTKKVIDAHLSNLHPQLGRLHLHTTFQFHFFRITQYNADAHNTHAHSSLWIHVRKPYPTSEGLSTDISEDSRSHQWRLVVDGNVAYHLTRNTGKSWKIQEKMRAPGFELWWVESYWTVLPLDYKPNNTFEFHLGSTHQTLCRVYLK
jgi:hypothetical protein